MFSCSDNKYLDSRIVATGRVRGAGLRAGPGWPGRGQRRRSSGGRTQGPSWAWAAVITLRGGPAINFMSQILVTMGDEWDLLKGLLLLLLLSPLLLNLLPLPLLPLHRLLVDLLLLPQRPLPGIKT